MTSAIDPTKPGTTAAYTVDMRANFAAAASEITALQAAMEEVTATAAPYVPETNPVTGTYGMYAFPNEGDAYISPDSYAITGSMTIRGQPYGGYDTGTLLSIGATTLPIQSSRAGVFAPGSVADLASYGWIDQVCFYNGIGSSPPPLKLAGVTYNATHIYPSPPLTATQIKSLRPNMWVITNSIDSSISIPPGNALKPETHYASWVVSWAGDGSSITVGGWAVPGSHNSAAGQVPSTTYDAGTSGTICYFGAQTNLFGANFVAQHNPVGQPDARSRGYQGIEFDFQNYSLNNYEMACYGLSFAYDGEGGVLPTSDSYAFKASGFPTGLIVDYTNHAIATDALNVYNSKSPPAWAGSKTLNVTGVWSNLVDSDNLQLIHFVSRDGSTAGWQGSSVHLQLWINTDPPALDTGTQYGQFIWNAPGYAGGVSLANWNGIPGITVDANGNVHINQIASGLNFGSRVAASETDLSQHITLFEAGAASYGFGITGSQLNYNAGGEHLFLSSGNEVAAFTSNSLSMRAGVSISFVGTQQAQVYCGDGINFNCAGGSFYLDANGNIFGHLINAANDAAALANGVPLYAMYRNNNIVMIRIV